MPIDGLVKVFHSLEDRSGWNVLAAANGLRLRQRFDPWQLIAAIVIAGLCALVGMALLTVEGTWAFLGMIACWVVFGVCVLGGLLSLRRASLVIDAETRTLRGQDLDHGAIDASFDAIREIELVCRRRPRNAGSAKLIFRVGTSTHTILDLDEIGDTNLSRAKGVAFGFAALFGVPCVDRSVEEGAGEKIAAHASTAAEAAVAFLEVLNGL